MPVGDGGGTRWRSAQERLSAPRPGASSIVVLREYHVSASLCSKAHLRAQSDPVRLHLCLLLHPDYRTKPQSLYLITQYLSSAS
ncbi:hypothetical protein EJB05_30918, partial [Eragrostis curvula]